MAVEISLAADVDRMAARLADFNQKLQDRIVSRALKRTASMAKTTAVREISRTYKIKQRTIRSALSLRYEGKGTSLSAELKMTGRPIGLYAFNAKAYGPRAGWPRSSQPEGGVQVTIKGKRVRIPHAFIARMRSGHVGVFARGSYYPGKVPTPTGETKGNFTFGTGRLPISELFSNSLPQAFSSKAVMDETVKTVRLNFARLLSHEIDFELSKK